NDARPTAGISIVRTWPRRVSVLSTIHDLLFGSAGPKANGTPRRVALPEGVRIKPSRPREPNSKADEVKYGVQSRGVNFRLRPGAVATCAARSRRGVPAIPAPSISRNARLVQRVESCMTFLTAYHRAQALTTGYSAAQEAKPPSEPKFTIYIEVLCRVK